MSASYFKATGYLRLNEAQKKEYSRIHHSFDPEYLELIAVPRARTIIDKTISDYRISFLGQISSHDYFSQFPDFDKTTFIYFSNHLSELDYILLDFIFFENRIRIPRILGGVNLLIPGVTVIDNSETAMIFDFRKCGMVSIDRPRISGLDRIYLKAFLSYMEDFFRKGEDMLVFPEGGRSRDGLVRNGSEFKTKIFDLIKKTQQNNPDRNYVLIPIRLTYDRVAEDATFVWQERIKKIRPHKVSHKIAALVDLYSFYRQAKKQPKGSIHIDFGKPVFAKEHLNNGTAVDLIVRENLVAMTRLTPTSLLAYSIMSLFNDGESVKRNFLKASNVKNKMLEVKKSIDSKRYSDIILNYEIDAVFDYAVSHFEKGRFKKIVKFINGNLYIMNKNILAYYANMIPHHAGFRS